MMDYSLRVDRISPSSFLFGVLVAAGLSFAGVGCDDKNGGSSSSKEESSKPSEASGSGSDEKPEKESADEAAPTPPPIEAHCIDTKVQPGLCKEFYAVMDPIREKCKAEKGTWADGKCPREEAIAECDRKERVEIFYSDEFTVEKAKKACADGVPDGEFSEL